MTAHLSRRNLLQGAATLTFAGVLAAGWAPLAQAAENATADDFLALRERWVDQITGRKLIVAGDPDFTAAIKSLDTAVTTSRGLLAQPATPTGIFTDAPFSADAQIVTTYKRLAQMATAWATPGSAYYNDQALLAQINAALEDGNKFIYNSTQAEYGNWWSWEIGVPRALADTLAILGENVNAALVAKYGAAIDHFIPDPTKQFSDERGKILSEGANRVDICQGIIVRSIVGRDAPRLSAAIAALSPVWQYVTSGNGFYVDGSFVQHSTTPYTGTYGVVLLGGLSKLFSLLGGSNYEVSDPSKSVFFNTVEDSFAPFIFDGQMMDSVRGRAISRTAERSFYNGTMAIEAILLLSRAVDPATAKRWQGICKGWVKRNHFANPMIGATVPRTALLKELAANPVQAIAEPLGHSFFAGMDRSVYRGNGWAFALGLSGRRTTWYECGNGENNLGYQTGSGMGYFYNSQQGAYDDNFWPTANLTRLPGITVDLTPLKPKVEGEWGTKTPQNDWTGGVSLAQFGAVGMHLVAPGGTGLTARKAWFYAPDSIIALGADISSPSTYGVESIMEHRNLGENSQAKITYDDGTTDGGPASERLLTAPQWVHLEGTGGYVLLGEQQLKVVRERRSGAWKTINNGGTVETVTRDYATMVFDHGVKPTDAHYAYAFLPNGSVKDTAKAAKSKVAVVRNDAIAQAVELDKKTIAALFWQAGSAAKISVSGPACVIFTGNPGQGTLALSDPSQGAESVTITLDGSKYRRVQAPLGISASLEQNGNKTIITVQTSGLLGKTVELKLHR